MVHEAGEPDLIFDFADACRLSGEHGTELAFAFTDTDVPGAHAADGALDLKG